MLQWKTTTPDKFKEACSEIKITRCKFMLLFFFSSQPNILHAQSSSTSNHWDVMQQIFMLKKWRITFANWLVYPHGSHTLPIQPTLLIHISLFEHSLLKKKKKESHKIGRTFYILANSAGTKECANHCYTILRKGITQAFLLEDGRQKATEMNLKIRFYPRP